MVMFASDFPHWGRRHPDFAARAFPPALRRRVLSETARELYRLPAPAGGPEPTSVADAGEAVGRG
jgi:predicted TIM-barrel fold metal-dependent hydrolase